MTLAWSVGHATSCEAQDGAVAWRSIVPDPKTGGIKIQIDVAGEYTSTLSCTNGEDTAVQQRQVTVLLAPTFRINAGLNDASFNPDTSGQGFFVTVFPVIGRMFVAWFTFDLERPDESVTTVLGEPGHHQLRHHFPWHRGGDSH